MMWTDRTLEGHAVVDVDDDDDGNELLDTESDGLWGPDADEEIEETIEGEILEEEDYGQDDRDDGVDMDQDEGLDLDDEVWKGVIHKLSTVAGLSRKEAMANSRNNIVGSSSLPVPVV
ncbi:hypothetical protein BGX27_004468 [Mortierella sp. AM989]|nr:hypothetical protein BGX27_004468 [Mortierella sp. AM989]